MRWKNSYLLTLLPSMLLYLVLIFNEKLSKKEKLYMVIINFVLWVIFWLVYDKIHNYW